MRLRLLLPPLFDLPCRKEAIRIALILLEQVGEGFVQVVVLEGQVGDGAEHFESEGAIIEEEEKEGVEVEGGVVEVEGPEL
jgi:hypothetical protein